MTCEPRERAAAQELSAVPGVESVTVDPDAPLVQLSGRSLEDTALRAAIDQAGYEAR